MHALANIFDALNLNTRASGNWGRRKPPEFPIHPRPKTKGKEEKEKVTVKSLFNRLKAGR